MSKMDTVKAQALQMLDFADECFLITGRAPRPCAGAAVMLALVANGLVTDENHAHVCVVYVLVAGGRPEMT